MFIPCRAILEVGIGCATEESLRSQSLPLPPPEDSSPWLNTRARRFGSVGRTNLRLASTGNFLASSCSRSKAGDAARLRRSSTRLSAPSRSKRAAASAVHALASGGRPPHPRRARRSLNLHFGRPTQWVGQNSDLRPPNFLASSCSRSKAGEAARLRRSSTRLSAPTRCVENCAAIAQSPFCPTHSVATLRRCSRSAQAPETRLTRSRCLGRSRQRRFGSLCG